MTKLATSGGRLEIDPAIADLYMAQLAVVCSDEGTAEEKAALAMRKKLLKGLSPRQRELAGVLAGGIGRLCGR